MMTDILKTLSDAGGISGFEYTVAPYVKSLLERYCDEVTVDHGGNVIGRKFCEDANAPTVMIEAHMDGIGLMVKEITERGFLTFVPIGGIDPRILPSAEVIVCGKKELYGVIGAKPPHLQKAGEQDKAPKIEDMAIDIGMTKEQAEQIVSVGDMVYFNTDAVLLGENMFSGKYLDDRAGVTALVHCLENIKDENLPFHLAVVCAVQEEVGLRGAVMSTYHINPAVAIVVDVCHGNTPDSGSNGVFKPGCGAVLTVGPNLHPGLVALAKNVAKEKDIPYEIEVEGGNTGTDAWATQVSREGVATLLLSLPLRYMHTTVETLSLKDMEATGTLIAEVLKTLDVKELGVCILKN